MPLSARFTVTKEWGDGYDGQVEVTNTGRHTVTDWRVECKMPFVGVTWMASDATWSPRTTVVLFEPQPWARTLHAGASTTIRFGGVSRVKPVCVRAVQLVPVPVGDESLRNRRELGPKVLAPYVDVRSYPLPDLAEVAARTGHSVFALAYVTSCGGAPAWAGVVLTDTLYMAGQVRELRMAGGDVIVSFGGPDGAELAEDVRDPMALCAAYGSVVDDYNLAWIEFAPCGPAALADDVVDTRNRAIRLLQERRPGLVVSYALPCTPEGLAPECRGVLRSAKACGARVDVVTVLAGNFGDDVAPNPAGRMAAYVRQAALNSKAHVCEFFPDAALGVAPTIGVNDVESEVVHVPDADLIAAFVADMPWMRYASFWSVNRDRDDGARNATFESSGIRQHALDFTKTFAKYLSF
jgi:hypothetical protein